MVIITRGVALILLVMISDIYQEILHGNKILKKIKGTSIIVLCSELLVVLQARSTEECAEDCHRNP